MDIKGSGSKSTSVMKLGCEVVRLRGCVIAFDNTIYIKELINANALCLCWDQFTKS